MDDSEFKFIYNIQSNSFVIFFTTLELVDITNRVMLNIQK